MEMVKVVYNNKTQSKIRSLIYVPSAISKSFIKQQTPSHVKHVNNYAVNCVKDL
jgi:hypothetical protein